MTDTIAIGLAFPTIDEPVTDDMPGAVGNSGTPSAFWEVIRRDGHVVEATLRTPFGEERLLRSKEGWSRDETFDVVPAEMRPLATVVREVEAEIVGRCQAVLKTVAATAAARIDGTSATPIRSGAELTPEAYVADFIANGEENRPRLRTWEKAYQDAGTIEEARRRGYVDIGRDPLCTITVTQRGRAVARGDLVATMTRGLPDGRMDDSTFEDVETALDRADAPCMDGDRWLTLPERIAAITTPGGEA